MVADVPDLGSCSAKAMAPGFPTVVVLAVSMLMLFPLGAAQNSTKADETAAKKKAEEKAAANSALQTKAAAWMKCDAIDDNADCQNTGGCKWEGGVHGCCKAIGQGSVKRESSGRAECIPDADVATVKRESSLGTCSQPLTMVLAVALAALLA